MTSNSLATHSNKPGNSGRPNGFFITGTDTDCGKTHATAALISHLSELGMAISGLKPIASGFDFVEGNWLNHDIEMIKRASSSRLPNELINRYAYKEAIAPHIAADKVDQSLSLELIKRDVEAARSIADAVVVEGVGGWLVPLDGSAEVTIENLAEAIDLPVILVVGLSLGCLNHALLSIRAIKQSNVTFAGWVANHIDPEYQYVDSNLETLRAAIDEPLLFELAYQPNCNGQVAKPKRLCEHLYGFLDLP